ncbi:molybdopterin-containing oxidoreductase family membrane subunit [Pseudomonas sp. Tn43]|uniref:NrfD/PsrC family molybdoenzyme membrane anchor subunit n=1 Tax=Pseudomonas sp. Tn43 TaxID=701213 RepID=UPI00160AFC30|nr:NrfD/PsrC family molybdoenzyme membrane anchor subunit [Pseudomonas sp. Tn43]MBB3242219.1 molybdopterin-containing oxidoreductase family membrane subunit [Pseudomonas sp. Tn43]
MRPEPLLHDTEHFLPRDLSDQQVSRQVFGPLQQFPRRVAWLWLFAIAITLLLMYLASAAVLLANGVGIWGNNQPVHWGLGILNYIWWLGIGHAGTFISAVLLLIERPWRHTLNRLAELMTLMAVICAALYPILHLGRPWLFYWILPYPNQMGLWPQFKSPTAWDMFAILSYLTVSLLFLLVGAIPDFATARDRAQGSLRQTLYGLMALGWRGSQQHWALWRRTSRVLAMLAIPLVFAVSSGYSFLLTMGPQSGWHSTLFPPYFVAGAVFSGFALVTLLAIGVRWLLHIEALITLRHLDTLGCLLLATGWLTAYGYLMDLFMPFYSGDSHEIEVLLTRLSGPHAWSFWLAMICNVAVLQALWWRSVRQRPGVLAAVALAVLVGMWAERFMLVIPPQTRDFLASTWGSYTPTLWDWTLFIGSFGVFLLPYSLFLRYVPMVSAFEVKQALHQERGDD